MNNAIRILLKVILVFIAAVEAGKQQK